MKACIFIIFFFVTSLFHPLEYFAAWFFAKKEKIVDLSANENSSNSFPAQGFPPFSSRAGVSYWRRLEGIVVACCSGAFLGRPCKHWNALWLHGTQEKKGSMDLPRPPSPYLPLCSFIFTLTPLTSLTAIPKLPLLATSNMVATQRKHWLSAYFRVSVVKPQRRGHTTTKPLFLSLSQYLVDNNLHDIAF